MIRYGCTLPKNPHFLVWSFCNIYFIIHTIILLTAAKLENVSILMN